MLIIFDCSKYSCMWGKYSGSQGSKREQGPMVKNYSESFSTQVEKEISNSQKWFNTELATTSVDKSPWYWGKLDLENAEEPEIKLPTSIGS